MGYGYWNPASRRDTREVAEKAYRRDPEVQAVWEDRWQHLSTQARRVFINVLKSPLQNRTRRVQQPSVSAEVVPKAALKELKDAEFVEITEGSARGVTDRVSIRQDLGDFTTRLRSLRRLHLLAEDQPSEFGKYVNANFYKGAVAGILLGVLNKVGIGDFGSAEEILKRYVIHHRWPAWVARALEDPVATRVLEEVERANGPVALSDLPARLPGISAEQVRAAVTLLIAHLALVEDLDPETLALKVGLLPSVREELQRAGQLRDRPSLQVCEDPREVGPDGSLIVLDLRAVLLEVATEAPRLRQDKALFSKEVERFTTALEPLPDWFLKALKWSTESRLNQALNWAIALDLVQEVSQKNQLRLPLTPKGNRWLSSKLEKQYEEIYRVLSVLPKREDRYAPHARLFYPGLDPFGNVGPGDMRFLGVNLMTVKIQPGGKRLSNYWDAKPEDYQSLRKSLDSALEALKPEVFYRLESVQSHLAFREHNPVNRGLEADQVQVYWGPRPVPPLEEQREEAGRLLIDAFVRQRLVPLGCVQAAIDAEGELCIARQPRLNAYFGRKVAESDLVPESADEARVVVQPDFSVIVIGLNPTPAAELAPFCERSSQRGTQVALTLKLTRESVIKALDQGLKPEEIVNRLERHASHKVPANVLKEVKAWTSWVRRVDCSTLTVLRCPDRETADRVKTALGRQAERLNETLVAVDQAKLTSTEKARLRSHGILVGEETGSEPKPRGTKKSRRRRRW